MNGNREKTSLKNAHAVRVETMLKALNKEIDKAWPDRYTKIGDYCFDKLIFSIYFLIIVITIAIFVQINSENLDYFKCNAHYDASIRCADPTDDICAADLVAHSKYCKNPFYQADGWKRTEYLLPGEYGNKSMPGNMQGFEFLIFFLLIASVIVNHLIYNMKFKDGDLS